MQTTSRVYDASDGLFRETERTEESAAWTYFKGTWLGWKD